MTSPSTFNIEMHPTLPVMMTRFEENFVFTQNALDYTKTVKEVLDSLESPVYYLFDLTRWNRMSFNDLMQAAAQAARGKETNFHHPMNRYTLLVTHDTLVSNSAQGMTSETYGNAKIKVFNSVADAIAFIEDEIG